MNGKLSRKRKECEEIGHKKIVWQPLLITSYNPYPKCVKGMCYHCNAYLERPLTSEETKRAYDFWNIDVKIPFNI